MQGKQKKLFTNKEFRTRYGTVDSKQFISIYLIIDSWVQPLEEIVKPESLIRKLKGNITRKLIDSIDYNLWKDIFIVDMDLRSSGFKLNKKSFMSIEITLYPKLGLVFNSEIITKQMNNISNIIINEIKQNKFKFTFNKHGSNTKLV